MYTQLNQQPPHSQPYVSQHQQQYQRIPVAQNTGHTATHDQNTNYMPLQQDNFVRVSNLSESGQYEMPTQTALHTYRGEIMQAAQRRDISRLKIMSTTLVRHHRLSPNELNQCLVLHHVAWTGELNDFADFLLSIGCDPYFPDINGDTVFHYVARGCNLSYLKTLQGIYGTRILEVLNNNHYNLFLTTSAEAPDDSVYQILNLMEWLYLHGCSIETQDANGKTGLMWACQRGSLILIHWFLARGANLAHRDHSGRTVLQMACLSGDEETLRTVCEQGAIGLLHCESNDDSESNTALKLCWNKGHFFLGLSLRQWYFQKKFVGHMYVFRNSYAWYYWLLTGTNFVIFIAISFALVRKNYNYWYYCCILYALCFLYEFCWILAFALDPGYVKKDTMVDQSYRCSSSFRHDLNQKPITTYRVTSACYKLHLLERENCRISAELTALNRHFGIRSGYNQQLPPDTEQKFEACVLKIQEIREQMSALMDKVGMERRLACPKKYTREVLEGAPHHICLTCRIIKPFRSHHCSECARCIHRFDHHCIWVDNCIGQGNQQAFLVFLCSLTTSIIYLWFLIIMLCKTHLIDQMTVFNWDIFTQPLLYIALLTGICNLVWLGFVGYLCFRTCKSMCTNITFYEYLKKPAYIQKRFNGSVYKLLWDASDLTFCRLLRNIYSFCTSNNHWDSIDYPAFVEADRYFHDDD